MPEAPTKYWRQLLGPALVSPHSYCVTRMSHERCVDVLPSAKVALWHTELASITTETEIAVQCLCLVQQESLIGRDGQKGLRERTHGRTVLLARELKSPKNQK